MRGIHPEFLLGLKGDKADKFIRSLALDVNFSSFSDDRIKEFKKNIKDKSFARRTGKESTEYTYSKSHKSDFGDSISNTHKLKIGLIHKVIENKSSLNIYHISKSFFNSVSQMKRKIPMNYLGSEHVSIFLKLPDVSINSVMYDGAYLSVQSVPESKIVSVVMTPKNEFTVMGCRIIVIGNLNGECDLVNVFREGADGVNSSLFSDIRFTPNDKKASNSEEIKLENWLSGLINSAVYVNSQDPEIDLLKPLRLYNKKQLKLLSQSKKENLCTLPVKLVNWDFHTGRVYSIGESQVISHMRWQPCGMNRSEVKLIWVKAHTRTYNKEFKDDITV